MAFEVQYDDFDPDDVGGKDRVLPGLYHMLVESVDEDGGKNGAMHVEFQVMRGSVQGMNGKFFPMDFSKDYGKWQQMKLAAFAIGTGLRTQKQLSENKKNRTPDPIDWSQAVGKSCCMEIEADEDGQYKGLPKLRFSNIWRPDDKRASIVPLHAEVIKREGIKLPADRHIDGVLAPKPNAAAAKESKPAAKKSAASEVSTDDLLEGVI